MFSDLVSFLRDHSFFVISFLLIVFCLFVFLAFFSWTEYLWLRTLYASIAIFAVVVMCFLFPASGSGFFSGSCNCCCNCCGGS